jgi:hypothetical protein
MLKNIRKSPCFTLSRPEASHLSETFRFVMLRRSKDPSVPDQSRVKLADGYAEEHEIAFPSSHKEMGKFLCVPLSEGINEIMAEENRNY